MEREVEIARLGHLGDGIAETPEGQVAIPLALAGETVRAAINGRKGEVSEILSASPDRITPACRHFGKCGGCQMQHMARPAYENWKRGLLEAALQREGIEADIAPMVSFPESSRRRAVFQSLALAKGSLLGFAERGSHRIVDLDECPVLLPALSGALPPIRALAGAFCGLGKRGGKSVRATVTLYSNGLEMALEAGFGASNAAYDLAARHEAARHFIRIALNGETLMERERPMLDAGIARVSPPAGAFIQAIAEAEEAMAGLVMKHLAGASHTADLFCGSGAFALRLAQFSTVEAHESDGEALAALDRAWRETGGRLRAIRTAKRDLFRRPLMAAELKKTEGVVFDPPRAGALAQAGELARSAVGRIAAVSCNPVTLARDLRLLIDGGYRLAGITPVDQFIHTPHLEAVALLER